MSFFIDRQGASEEAQAIAAEDADNEVLEMEIPSGSDFESGADDDDTLRVDHTHSNFIQAVETNIQQQKRGKRESLTSKIKRRLGTSGAKAKNVRQESKKTFGGVIDSSIKVTNTNDTKTAGDANADDGMFNAAAALISSQSPKPTQKAKKGRFGKRKAIESDTIAIPEKTMKLYQKGEKVVSSHIRKTKVKEMIRKEEAVIEEATEKAAKYDMFLSEEPGYIDIGDEELIYLDQDLLQKNVDVSSAVKRFDLNLRDFGPYKVKYTRNGKFLLIGGKMGHIAAFDWFSKMLKCEINVMETVNDICWLHNENMFAAAQKRWVHIYDNQGVELHALRQLDNVNTMQFLPYHFLLSSMNSLGFLTYLDVSIGQIVATLRTNLKGVREMVQNPQNAVVFTAHPNGIVNLWAPSSNKPLAKMACHRSAVASMAVDNAGHYLATSGIDRRLRIFDLRMFSPVHSYKLSVTARSLDFSQKGLLAAAFPRNVDIFRDICGSKSIAKPYLSHRLHKTQIGNVQFCPYEDVVGIGHQMGVSSLLVPGAGEPNFDCLEANPYATKKQRQEAEVKNLLDKIQPEMISLDNDSLLRVETEGKVSANPDDLKIPKVVLKAKAKGKSKSMKKEQRKAGLKEKAREEIRKRKRMKEKKKKGAVQKSLSREEFDPLSRFSTAKR